MQVRSGWFNVAVCLALTSALLAQDPVNVDPKHYSIICGNDRVRVLKVHYGPHEKSVWHSHPSLVVVFLTDTKATITFKGGRRSRLIAHAGEAVDSPPIAHLPENTSDRAWDVIEVELKQPSVRTGPSVIATAFGVSDSIARPTSSEM